MTSTLRTPTHPEMKAALEACIDLERGYGLWRDGDAEILHVHSWRDLGPVLYVYRCGTLHRVPMDERLTPKVMFRLWRATRV